MAILPFKYLNKYIKMTKTKENEIIGPINAHTVEVIFRLLNAN